MVMNDMTDDGKWGAEIAVDDIPEGAIEEGTHIQWFSLSHRPDWNVGANYICFSKHDLKHFDTIRLPASHPHYQQAQPIDWSAPIEVLLDGSWVPARIEQRDGASDRLPYCLAYGPYRGQWFTADGKHCNDGEYVRNTQPATQAQTLTAQERLERMEALGAKLRVYWQGLEKGAEVSSITIRDPETLGFMRALVAETEPVVDGDLVEARRMVAHMCHDGDWADMWASNVCEGKHDQHESVVLALACLKRGRELARGDVA